MAGKRGSRRHSTTSFSENVEVAETSYQMLEVLSFCHQERVQPPSLKVTVLTFLVKNGKMKLSGESIFLEYAKKLKESNLVLVVVLESKGLYRDLLVRCIKKRPTLKISHFIFNRFYSSLILFGFWF